MHNAPKSVKVSYEGYDVILTPSTHTYLDHAQYPDPKARGLMWATRFSNLWKTFSFRPMDMYKNGLYDESGYKINSGCEPGTDEGFERNFENFHRRISRKFKKN